MSTESGVLFNTQYSFRTRFDEGIGTNPDELIAASLGGCFSMALSNELELSGLHAERIETTATATLEEPWPVGRSRAFNSTFAPRCRTRRRVTSSMPLWRRKRCELSATGIGGPRSISAAAARQQVIASQTAVDGAQVNLNTAQRELKRVTDLIESGVASRSEYDAAHDRFSSAKIALTRREQTWKRQRLR